MENNKEKQDLEKRTNFIDKEKFDEICKNYIKRKMQNHHQIQNYRGVKCK